MVEDIVNRTCVRCGYIKDLEKHHIIHRIDGGSNDNSNLRWLCRGCHDYQHAKETVEKAIKAEELRISVLRERLRIIKEYNSPDTIRAKAEEGKISYQAYFEIFSESLPPETKCGRQ